MKNIIYSSYEFILIGFFVVAAFVLVRCGAGDGSPDASTPNDTATLAQTPVSNANLLLSTMQSFLAEGSSSSHQTKSVTLHGRGRSTEEEYRCTHDYTNHSSTCLCPGGGSMSWYFEEESTPPDGYEFSHSFREVFSNCVMNLCGQNKTINGDTTGRFWARYANGQFEGHFEHGTTADCSGIKVNDTEMGFYVSGSSNGTSETISGRMRIAPDCTLITFNSYEELRRIVDKENSCRYDEDDRHD